MANRKLFKSTQASKTVVNNAGGVAYSMSDEHALVQLAVTGTMNDTYYVQGEAQLEKILELAQKVSPQFLAQVAVYSRERGYMKDMPAILAAILSNKNTELLKKIFNRVCDSPKMVRNFCQIIRSGKVGRTSFGTASKKLIQKWLLDLHGKSLINATVGNDPALADIIKMVRPAPKTDEQRAYFAWVIGKEVDTTKLPVVVQEFIKWQNNPSDDTPEIDFRLLSNIKLSRESWTKIALRSSWQMIRQNLNTFLRHGVFEDTEVVKKIAQRLRNPEEVAASKCFPYQLLAAYINISKEMPREIVDALHDALEIAVQNVPAFHGKKVVVCPDVSTSMHSPVTGYRKGATSRMRCVDVAGLVSACVLRNNPDSNIVPFECSVVNIKLEPRDSVMTNAQKLANVGGGGTNCSAPLAKLLDRNITPDIVVYVSDNESWVDRDYGYGTTMSNLWNKILKKNPEAKLVCIDIVPNDTVQVLDRKNCLNIGGFSDNVFEVISSFIKGESVAKFVETIKQIKL